MAVKPFKILNQPWSASGVIVVLWENLVLLDTGQPFICPHFADKSVQVIGTFGASGNCSIEGSNMIDSPTYAVLNDPQGNPLTVTSAKIETLLENTYLVRPNITLGDGTTDLDIYLLVHTTR